ncbi:MAG: aldo/keto reductase [Pseudomonadota bacterium]
MPINRRILLKGSMAAALSGAAALQTPARAATTPLARPIASSGEMLPLVGLGSWITFNVGNNKKLLDASSDVMAAFFESGGRMIDSSPMYGSAQATIGYGLKKLGMPEALFSADKVWTSSASNGGPQIEASRSHWGIRNFDLVQVHNLVAWRAHLELLQAMKAAGNVRYVGITTSHGRRHAELEEIMTSQPIDFVQLTYNVEDREAEQRLLPLARERGIAVIVNRPFQRGYLIERLSSSPLPDWVAETGASSWAQFLLKFVISHPAVTCAIPATSQVEHVRENMAAASGILPDTALRNRMADYVGQL